MMSTAAIIAMNIAAAVTLVTILTAVMLTPFRLRDPLTADHAPRSAEHSPDRSDARPERRRRPDRGRVMQPVEDY